jgi:hypothetical protein
LRIAGEKRQSPSKFGAEDFDTPLPRPPFACYSLRVFKRHGA